MATIREQFKNLNRQGVLMPWQTDDTYPISEVPSYVFNPLPTVEVIGEKPFNFLDYVTGRIGDWYDEENKTNPIFGDRRIQVVGNHYDSNNPFRQGNDDVANGIMAILLTTATGLGLGQVAKALMTEGANAIPGVLAAIAGAKGGQVALDEVTKQMTGRSWTNHMQEAGLSSYNLALFLPGAWGGSYAASKIVNGLLINGIQWEFNLIPRQTITPNGERVINPGETVTEVMPVRTVGNLNAPQGQTRYDAIYTTNGGAGINSGTGLSHRTLFVGGIQPRRMGDFNSSSNSGVGTQTYTYTNPYIPMSSVPGYTLPWLTVAESPNKVYLDVPYVPNSYRYEELTPYNDPFYQWFGSMKGTDKENTIQYWNGTNSSFKAGPYYISWSNYADPRIERRRIGDEQGNVVRDSTTVKRTNNPREEVNQLTPGVPADAVRLDEKIRGFKIGGQLIPKVKSGIHIKKKNKGKFTKSAKQAGLSVLEHAKSVLNNPNATPLQKKRANFARNAAKWNKK